MVNFPTWIPDCDSHSPVFLDLFISSDTSICSAMSSAPLDHVVVSISIDFPSNSKWVALFHYIVCDYSCVDWDGRCDHLRDVLWEDIFKLSLVLLLMNFVSGFSQELIYIIYPSL